MQNFGNVVIFLGPPGSGKGTQASFVSQEWSLPHLSTGDMLRKEIANKTALGKEINSVVTSGGLVSEDIINQIVTNRLDTEECMHGCVLDGYPRTLFQAEYIYNFIKLEGWKPIILHFAIDDDVVIGRIMGRYSCKDCGAIYHQKFCPPKNANVCDICKSENFLYRADDELLTVANRLLNYHCQTESVLKFLREKENFFSIDASQPVRRVRSQVADVLKKC